ncbi:MAG: type II toxin-antitoxin system RelE/ParE family toxin [Ignavibacteria bacterium]|jgi:toxin YoeB|nr:type II toxin-antitoxin system RelE/ParE family toxin [Ignavibacteria bacterium]
MVVEWADTALIQIDEAVNYWNNRNQSATYSKKLLSNIETILDMLEVYPYMGKRLDNADARSVSLHPYRIIYRIDDDVIHILAFWHNSQEPDKLLDAIN